MQAVGTVNDMRFTKNFSFATALLTWSLDQVIDLPQAIDATSRVELSESKMSEAFTVQLGHGQSPWFQVETGQVLEESKRTETSLRHSSAVRHDGFTASQTTSASTVHNRTHSVWIEKDTGGEMEVEIPSHDFSVPTGHRVSVAFAGNAGSERGPFVGAVNHSTGATWTIGVAGLKPVAEYSTAWTLGICIALVVPIACWLGGASLVAGLVMLLGPAEILAWLAMIVIKLPKLLKQQKAVVTGVARLVANMKQLGDGTTAETLAKSMEKPESA